MAACYGEPLDRPPVWFMRQAGRIFPEYRTLREQHEFMEVCRDPELTSRVTRMPVDRLGVDAAIIFADIMHPLHCLGINYDLVQGTGPVIDDPVRTEADVDGLASRPAREAVGFLEEGIRRTREDLPPEVPLIGFAGAPFTMACYLVEGQPSRQFSKAKQLMFARPDLWDRLLSHLSDVLVDYLTMQIEAGVEVIQLFDSWAGGLNPRPYRKQVLPHVEGLIDRLRPLDVPLISFATGNPELLTPMDEANPDVIGVDWRIDLLDAHQKTAPHRPLQGNLDPSLLLAPWERIEPELDSLLKAGGQLAGHIVNLGHGILPDTDPETARRVVEYVQEFRYSPD